MGKKNRKTEDYIPTKTIIIRKSSIINLIISFVFGFGILFGLEHLGEFSYRPLNDGTLLSINYETYFDNEIETEGNGFQKMDIYYKNGEFHKYSNKLYYYVESFKKDAKFGFLISITIFSVLCFFNYFNFELK
ncbi:hypothetical protein [Flavobacterium sp. TAB 87]|uniref:hypothetical protein n=1 Tax=Flavobacterium sp. TAB 87 TaxID=1729581 RepID=UPI00076BD4EC|nr:hypothetical protein [Flavobacterium sp. TAB 87]KVV16407.1 hypothetical protein AP058_00047 [Flavobacterium sp. TAB 87]